LVSAAEIITKQVFAAPEPPRWVLLCGGKQLLLLDRTKWPSKRFLRFDFEEILGRREQSTLRAVSALLHRDSVCPSDQITHSWLTPVNFIRLARLRYTSNL
jgi:hypothetical protein